ncbi:hypothetical protein [Glutamicibacter sp. V16R2B1]|uniref:hypothetical protein n=1 Tax=Glutamicibacter sp. V16R2B1 TaxID=2036207 RepID=UPI0010FE3BAB|nr:hypothetical protein [Glutamicibacter sp. V16R2B1]MCK9901236.1 hypothetical protein [Frankia sp. Cpl3]TLK46886.1 hypothetical protein FDN03_16060 [Glutamicibacter sp. V16R2B1]
MPDRHRIHAATPGGSTAVVDITTTEPGNVTLLRALLSAAGFEVTSDDRADEQASHICPACDDGEGPCLCPLAPAEETSAEGLPEDGDCPHCPGTGCVACSARHLPAEKAERAFMACPATHLPEMACGTCGWPAEGADRG